MARKKQPGWRRPLALLVVFVICLGTWHIFTVFQSVPDLAKAAESKMSPDERTKATPHVSSRAVRQMSQYDTPDDIDANVDSDSDDRSAKRSGAAAARSQQASDDPDEATAKNDPTAEDQSPDEQGSGDSVDATADSVEEAGPALETIEQAATGGDPGALCAHHPKNESAGRTLLRIYQQLCAWGVSGAGGVKRLAGERRNFLSSMYTPLIQVEPLAPFVGTRPGGALSTDASICKNGEYSSLLTGKLNPKGPRMVIDVFTGMGGGPELELLELRLHELDGVADINVVVESHFGNHGDRKPMHFNCQKNRYSQFLDRILHVRTDLCPKYVKAAERVQRDTKRGQGGVWNLQGMQRGCAVDALNDRMPAIPDDALVILSDLDELPSGKAINLLKRCEIKEDVKWPMFMKLKVVPFSLRTGCPPTRDLYTKGSVTHFKKFKEGKISVWPLPGKAEIPHAGVHLSSMGSLGQVSYKLLNHGESAQIASLVTPHDVDINTCDVKDMTIVHKLQQELSEKPISVMRHWERSKNLAKKPLKLVKDLMDDLKKCELPWPLLLNPHRYQFLWGDGNLDA